MSEIESVKPILTVIEDEGDLILSSTGPRGKAMAQAVLAQSAGSKKITIISDGEMKVMKRSGIAEGGDGQAAVGHKQVPVEHSVNSAQRAVSRLPVPALNDSSSDVQDEFIADVEAGVTGEVATGEVPAPASASKRRRPQIFQDAAAPPAPELAEAEMDRLMAEAQQAEQDAARQAEDQRFQRQQAVQAQTEASDVPGEQPADASKPRKREPRQLATTGRACGRCGGGGKVMGEAGFVGACPVCQGQGQVKTWDRALKVR